MKFYCLIKCSLAICVVLALSLGVYAEELGFTAEELLQLNRNYWDRIYSLDIEYFEEYANGGKLLISIPSSKWILTPAEERLQTHGWYPVRQDVQAGDSSVTENVFGFETHKVDFLRKTGEYYLFLRGCYSDAVTPTSLMEADDLDLSAGKVDDTVFDSGSFENFFLRCPGNTWLNMRSGFLMRFSDVLNSPDETLESFAKKNRVSRPEFSTNSRQERVWTFKIWPKTPWQNETDDMRYIEVCFNECHDFLLERLAYYCFQKWGNSPEEKLVVDNSFVTTNYFRLENGISFPKEIQVLRHAVEDPPESGLCQTITLTSAKINETVDKGVFDFRIPPYVRVTHFPPVQNEGELFFVESIWGQDNKPLIIFTEPGQFEAFLKEQYESGGWQFENTSISPFRIFLTISGIVLIVVALLLRAFRGQREKNE